MSVATSNLLIHNVRIAPFGAEVLRHGINGALRREVRSLPDHPDALAIRAPLCNDVLIISSVGAWRALLAEDPSGTGCPYGRGNIMGPSTPGNKIASFPGDIDSGLSLSPASDSQKRRKHEARARLNRFDTEGVASDCVAALEEDKGVDPLEVVLARVIRPALLDHVLPPREDRDKLHDSAKRRLTGAAATTVFSPRFVHKGIEKALSIMDRFHGVSKKGFAEVAHEMEGPFTASDVAQLYATTGATVSAAYWLAEFIGSMGSERSELRPVDTSVEALRYGGLNTIIPPRPVSYDATDWVCNVSPTLVLHDPRFVGDDAYEFNPDRYIGESGVKLRQRVVAAAFGYGVHRCPSALMLPSFLEALAHQMQQSDVVINRGDHTKPNQLDFNAYIPRRRFQARVVN